MREDAEQREYSLREVFNVLRDVVKTARQYGRLGTPVSPAQKSITSQLRGGELQRYQLPRSPYGYPNGDWPLKL